MFTLRQITNFTSHLFQHKFSDLEIPSINVLSKNKKNREYPFNPSFTMQRGGHVVRYYEIVYERSRKNMFKVLGKLKSRGFHASSLSTHDVSTVYHITP